MVQKSIFQYCFNLKLNRENAFAKTKILPKAAKSIFQYFFNLKLNRENAFAKTKILPNAAKIQFEIEQKYNFLSVGWETW